MKKITSLIIILFVFMIAGNALALSHLGEVVPDSLIVDAGGLEWVYAGPCAPTDPSCGVVQLHHGFYIPGTAEWNASFSDLNALLTAFNIGVPNEVVPNAAPYFNVSWDHIDIGDAQSGWIWGAPFVDADHASNPASEAFLVRGTVGVPEPATMLLLGLGLMGVAGVRRKIKK